MGLEIYMTGSKLLARWQANLRRRIERAEARRDEFHKRSTRYKVLEIYWSNLIDLLCSGTMGYIRSNYNEEGLFSVLEVVFGVDPVSLLFSENWDSSGPHPLNPKRFLSKLRLLEGVARTLKDGDSLPVIRRVRRKLRYLPPKNPTRQAGEKHGRALAKALGVGGLCSDQSKPRRFSRKRDEPAVAWALKELRDFGGLGVEIQKAGEPPCYVIDA